MCRSMNGLRMPHRKCSFYDCSKLYLNTSDNKIYYCDRYDATPLKSWDSLSAMLTSEIERIFSLFDADGHIISRMAPTTPVSL